MIATAEVLDEPTHTMEPRFNFLADHLLSDLHADNALYILKSRIRGQSDFPKYFSITYKIPLPHLAATAQELKTLTAVKIVLGVTDYTHGPGVDAPLILHTEDATTKEIKSDYYLSDALGSITELVSKDGTIDGEIVYNAYGKIIHSSGNALDQCYSYTGREFDRESRLYYVRTRFYDPQIGIFITDDKHSFEKFFIEKNGIAATAFQEQIKDMKENPNLAHRYAFAKSNPIKNVDPFGTSPTDPWALEIMQTGMAISAGLLGIAASASTLAAGMGAIPTLYSAIYTISYSPVPGIFFLGSNAWSGATGLPSSPGAAAYFASSLLLRYAGRKLIEVAAAIQNRYALYAEVIDYISH